MTSHVSTASLLAFFLVGCGACEGGPLSSAPRVVASEASLARVPDAPSRPTEVSSSGTRLHTDAQIRRLAHYDIDATCVGCGGILDLPSLDVVPSGETRLLGEVFRALGIEEARLRDRRQWQEDMATFLRWRVSPSYDIVCITDTDDPANEGLDVFDPKRMVYGIRFVMQGDGP